MQESVMQRMWNSAHLSGGNAAYVEELYELYLHDPNAERIECQYPLVHQSGRRPYHFIHGFEKFLAERLRVTVEPKYFRGDLHLWVALPADVGVERYPTDLTGHLEEWAVHLDPVAEIVDLATGGLGDWATHVTSPRRSNARSPWCETPGAARKWRWPSARRTAHSSARSWTAPANGR